MSNGGYNAYERSCRLYIIPALGRMKLSKLAPVGLQQWQANLEKIKSPFIARKASIALSSALQQAVYWHLIDRNPMRGVRAVQLPKKEAVIWQPSECAAFLEAAKDEQYFVAYYFILSTGVRVDELRGLKWSDLKTMRGVTYAHLQRQNDYDGATPVFTPTKNKQTRLLDLAPDLLELLSQHKYQQDEFRARAGSAWPDYDLIFTTYKGTPASPGKMRSKFNRVASEVGNPYLKLHELRHTAGSLWLDAGTSLEDVSKRLGHSSIQVTERIYIHKIIEAPRPVGMSMTTMLKGVDVETGGEATKKDPEAA